MVTYGAMDIRATVRRSQNSVYANGHGEARSNDEEVHRSFAEGLTDQVDRSLRIAANAMEREGK